jgi:hypothetical protein
MGKNMINSTVYSFSRWQSFRKEHKTTRQSVAPKAPLKKSDKLGTGLTSWEDERKNEDQVRRSQGHAETGSGYTTFKKKDNAEDAAERKRTKLIESRTRPDKEKYYLPAGTFDGWKFDYIFTTRSEYGTGYFWDGMDSVKKLRGEELPEQKSETSHPVEGTEDSGTIEKPKKKKRKKNAGPVIVNDPNNPLEQVAAAIQKRNQQLLGIGDPTLPPGWEVAKDPFSGKTYYFNRPSGERSWEKPQKTPPTSSDNKNEKDDTSESLPTGWQAVTDKQNGNTYFYHADGRTQWDRPT